MIKGHMSWVAIIINPLVCPSAAFHCQGFGCWHYITSLHTYSMYINGQGHRLTRGCIQTSLHKGWGERHSCEEQRRGKLGIYCPSVMERVCGVCGGYQMERVCGVCVGQQMERVCGMCVEQQMERVCGVCGGIKGASELIPYSK